MQTKKWSILRTIYLIAGSFIVISIALSLYVDYRFVFFTLFVGLMQIIFATTGYCPMAILLSKLGLSE